MNATPTTMLAAAVAVLAFCAPLAGAQAPEGLKNGGERSLRVDATEPSDAALG